MAVNNDIGLAEPSTITHRLATVTQNWNSTVRHQELMTLAGAESTLEIVRVVAAAPASTAFGVVVRIADPIISSLAGVVAISPVSTASVRVTQSTAADLNVTVAGYVAPSTVITIARMVGNSSAGDYMPVRVVDSSGTGYLTPGLEYTDGSTTSTLAAPGLAYRNSSNDTMRLVGMTTPLPVQLVKTPTRASVSSTITSTASTAFYEVISSAASTVRVVYAYSVTSTAVTPFGVEFLSGTNTVIWGVDVGSASSGVTGANLAVTPPGGLFQTAASANMNVRFGSTGVQVRVSLSYFSES